MNATEAVIVKLIQEHGWEVRRCFDQNNPASDGYWQAYRDETNVCSAVSIVELFDYWTRHTLVMEEVLGIKMYGITTEGLVFVPPKKGAQNAVQK